jgi:shikimate dehydrogenase
MKKYLVIGNPIEHSLSPQLHNFWIKENNIKADYNKRKINKDEIKSLILNVRDKKINGLNVTVPYKKEIINHLDELTHEANKTQSVNTVFLDDDKVIGHNTDIRGFELAIKKIDFDIKDKEILILGAGGVVPSIIFALYKMEVRKISVMNRTRSKTENLKNLFKEIVVLDWGEIPDCDTIINATSIGLKKNDKINLDFSKISKNKLFYDIIYNPDKTNFLKTGRDLGNKTENGKMMFIYQAIAAFKIWHGLEPKINNDVIKLLEE